MNATNDIASKRGSKINKRRIIYAVIASPAHTHDTAHEELLVGLKSFAVSPDYCKMYISSIL
jgi:hypothetical protein